MNANQPGAVGSGTITVTSTNGTIANENVAATNDNNTISNNIVLAPTTPAAGWLFSVGTGKATSTMNFTGNISGASGDLVISADGDSVNSNGNGTTILSGVNTYSGATILNNGPTSGVFRLGSATALPTGTALIFGRGVQGIGGMDLAGQNISIASLESTGVSSHGITNSDGANGGNITITGSATKTFAPLIGAITATNVNLPTRTNNVSLTLDAAHTGNLTLTAANTYAGATTINGGTLTVGNTTAGVNTIAGVVNVNSGGRLASIAGTQATTAGVAGLITVNAGGAVAPGGTSVGTLAANGGMTVNNNSTLDFTLASLDELRQDQPRRQRAHARIGRHAHRQPARHRRAVPQRQLHADELRQPDFRRYQPLHARHDARRRIQLRPRDRRQCA